MEKEPHILRCRDRIQTQPWEVLLYLNTTELSIATVINRRPSS